MKTLSINPLNLKPTIKKVFRTPKHVVIPAELPKELGNKLVAMQGSLDYIATNYNIDIIVHNDAPANVTHITCKNKKTAADSHQITLQDDDATAARKIYEAVSNVLLGYEKYK